MEKKQFPKPKTSIAFHEVMYALGKCLGDPFWLPSVSDEASLELELALKDWAWGQLDGIYGEIEAIQEYLLEAKGEEKGENS